MQPHQGQTLAKRGKSLEEAQAAMILIHGRGATAEGMLGLVDEFYASDWAYLAPQAWGHSWYPYSFLAPIPQNEPGLSSGLWIIDQLVQGLLAKGLPSQKIVLLGFSQGACLALEYAARHPRPYGGIIGLSGGLIGPSGPVPLYEGDMGRAPVFLGCSDVDPHIPLERVQESSAIFKSLGAEVREHIYPNLPHTVVEDELIFVRQLMADLVPPSEPSR
ncbi:MAG: alpha/beta fold hydrolase [Microscillaceae bacterium]|nr:alpha/beta fold hydrolase [Microscillaceae bacterium]